MVKEFGVGGLGLGVLGAIENSTGHFGNERTLCHALFNKLHYAGRAGCKLPDQIHPETPNPVTYKAYLDPK